MVLSIGQKAPNFRVTTDENQTFDLSDYLGQKVIIYFYPKDDTPGCTLEACDFRESMATFNQLNCNVIGISKDSVSSHVKFKQKYSLNFPLGADEDGKVCELYGVLAQKSMFGKKYFGIQRATFLIDEAGTIQHIWPNVKVSNHINEIIDLIKR